MAPGTIHVARLQEAFKAGVGAVDGAALGGVELIQPITAAGEVHCRVVGVAEGAGQCADDKVVVRIFDRSRDGTRFEAVAIGVEVVSGDVA